MTAPAAQHTAAAHVLTARERRVLQSVCEGLLPRLEPGQYDDAALFALDAATVGVPAAVEQAIASFSARQRRELRLFLRLIDNPLFMFVAVRARGGISSLSGDARERALLALGHHRLPQLRSGFQALKRLATFLFYSVLGADGANPTWKSIRYELPRRAPGSAAVKLTTPSSNAEMEADVCVIGSGAGGGVVAATLAARGFSVIVLEAGPPDQASDYDQREVIGMQRLYLDQGATSTRDLSVAMLAGSALGGGTAVNWQTSLRPPDFIRDEWADRSGVRWIAGDELTLALDHVSTRMRVGTAESQRNGNNLPLERGCASLGWRWQVIERNSHGCDLDQCGFCVFGCRVGGKQSTLNTFLRDAQQTGRTTIVASCKAVSLLRLTSDKPAERRIGGVHAIVRDASGGERPVAVRARAVVVAGGALETAAFLLRSGVKHRELGRNLHLHPTSAVAGLYADDVRPWLGAPQTILCDEFARARGNYGYRFEAAPAHPGLFALAQQWHGARHHREQMQHAARASAIIVLSRDRSTGRVSIDREGRAVIDYRIGKMERELLAEGLSDAARIHFAAGAEQINTLHIRDFTFRRTLTARRDDAERFFEDIEFEPVHGNRCAVFSAHQMGTCRIGADPASSVCDENGQVWGEPGLYVADGSLFPASSGVNPMLTIAALARVVGSRIEL